MKLVLLSLITSAIALGFQGTGQIRTLQALADGGGIVDGVIDLGCLTSQGQWTADDTLCDVFSGTRHDKFNITLNTSAGVPLGLDNVKVAAREGLTSTTWILFYGGLEVIPGRDLLGYGEYGVMASTADYVPKTPADPPVTIELWGSLDIMPFVYLSWQAE